MNDDIGGGSARTLICRPKRRVVAAAADLIVMVAAMVRAPIASTTARKASRSQAGTASIRKAQPVANAVNSSCSRRCMADLVSKVLKSMVVHDPYTLPLAWDRGAASLPWAPPPRPADPFLDLGPVQPIRQQDHRRDGPRRGAHARRDPRQPDGAADRGAHHRHARLHRDDLRRLRPPWPTVRPPGTRSRPPAPLPPRTDSNR